jgi:hypothetical protein
MSAVAAEAVALVAYDELDKYCNGSRRNVAVLQGILVAFMKRLILDIVLINMRVKRKEVEKRGRKKQTMAVPIKELCYKTPLFRPHSRRPMSLLRCCGSHTL